MPARRLSCIGLLATIILPDLAEGDVLLLE